MNEHAPIPNAARDGYRLGRLNGQAWRVADGHVSTIRPRSEPRPALFAARPKAVEIDLERTALIVIDMQNDFLHAEGWFSRAGHSAKAPTQTIETLAKACRAASVPVVWLNWGVRAGAENLPASTLYRGKRDGLAQGYGERAEGAAAGEGALERGSWGAGLVDGLTREPGDFEVFKHRFSGFPDTELDSLLRNLSVDTLLFAGINTDRCVFATLTDASARGYDCVLVRDACGTLSPPPIEDSVIWLIDLLYGFSTETAALLPTLTASRSQG